MFVSKQQEENNQYYIIKKMILQPANVELTKVHYYGSYMNQRNAGISTITGGNCKNYTSKHVIIKKNIFGHKWVLNIQDRNSEVKKRKKIKVILYILVFCCIIVAICFGIYFSLEPYFFPITNSQEPSDVNSNNTYSKTSQKQVEVSIKNETNITNKNNEKQNSSVSVPTKKFLDLKICGDCSRTQNVCLKIEETKKPQCLKIVDPKDPTGCGGLCKINTQYCQLLDFGSKVYQCSEIKNYLHCPNNTFNCGNMCIAINKRCDGVIDCSNYLDEKHCECDMKTNFQCGNNTSCLDRKRKCDGQIDCWDKSDEENCNKLCGINELSCINGQCIPKENFCDGIFHCEDKSDEPKGCQV